ncbi:hypothetical protein [Actinophytocola algeriensis]|uniref:Uncharacterized protein n=1 Tax=Actinophytocola algeriensis TaxID=1768010 RepID=A0A7W7Q2G8_9PSEU|nr:hypothetical protein [Actinophytocola algeriensis]MBB4905598.1 hypothetical protein [Actinophytocola algeriensis]MBE1472717.1 hypothetical protein [Actinophytocola algeriensis]
MTRESDNVPAGYPGFRVRDPATLRPTPATLRRVAHAKLSSVEFFSAALRGEDFVFTPWLTTLIDHGGAMRFLGVYRSDPVEDFGDDDAPPDAVRWLGIRRSEWIRDVDVAQANQAPDVGQYLAAGPQVSERYAFATTDTVPQVVEATRRLVSDFARGITVSAPGSPDSRWQEVTVDVADDGFIAGVNYSPLLARSEVVESHLPFWQETVDRVALQGGVAPDGEIDLTIRRSVPEIVSAPYRAPRSR